MQTSEWWNDPKKKAAAVEKMRERAQQRWPSKLSKYGITEDVYRQQIAAGNKWCTGHKRFESREAFSSPENYWPCREFIRNKSKSLWDRLAPEKKREISKKQYEKHGTPEQRRKRYLWHTFRLRPKDWDAMLERQNGKCAICGCEPEENHGGFRFAVDHNHSCCAGRRSCGKCVRGLLCKRCNQKLGFIEREDWIPKALAYVQRYDRNP